MSEMPTEVVKASKFWRILFTSIIAVVTLTFLVAGVIFVLMYNHKNTIHAGVKIESVSLGGLTKTQAKDILSGQVKLAFGNGYQFKSNATERTINDTERKIFDLNYDNNIEQAFNLGRNGSLLQNSWNILSAAVLGKTIKADYYLDKDLLKNKLQEEFKAFEKPSQDADLEINILNSEAKKFEIILKPSTTGGLTYDYNSAINELEKNLLSFNNTPVVLNEKNDTPHIDTVAAEKLKPELEKLISQTQEIKLIHKDIVETINWVDLTSWFHIGLNDQEEPSIILDETIVKGQLIALAQRINKNPVNAKLQMKDSKVTEFQASQTGLELDIDASYAAIKTALFQDATNTINVVVKEAQPEVALKDINGLGIKEIIGSGSSDFSGSPNNRRVNIGVGAASVHGVLIAPNEEFSLVKVLGDVDAKNGYLPELVIKENKTIPEYGGGLCQIATTVFRAALDAGLKITERANHSYRVVYYEPAGTDATIYIPKPDVRFINDTQNYILFQSTLKGNTLTFDVWGASDGRQITFEGQNKTDNIKDLQPKIFNITVPGPAKEIETTELKPGERKRTETAHNGADTSFSRTVTFADGKTETVTWKSHYVPWQAVYLIGVDPAKKEAEAKAAEEAANPPIAPDPNAPPVMPELPPALPE